MKDEELQKLKALALAATPGPWLHRHDPGNPAGCQHGVKLPGEFGTWIGDCLDNADRSTDGGVAGQRNAAFIAAANPATVLAMIERVESLPATQAPSAPVAPDERAAFEAAMNARRFFPAELDFSMTKSPSGKRDEYVNTHLESCWNGWQARAALSVQAETSVTPQMVRDQAAMVDEIESVTAGLADIRQRLNLQDKPAAIPEGYALTLIDQSYDQRVQAIIAHNQCKGGLDDKLRAAYAAAVNASPTPPTTGEATPSTLAQQVAAAQAGVATWPDGKLARVKLAGGDQP